MPGLLSKFLILLIITIALWMKYDPERTGSGN